MSVFSTIPLCHVKTHALKEKKNPQQNKMLQLLKHALLLILLGYFVKGGTGLECGIIYMSKYPCKSRKT